MVEHIGDVSAISSTCNRNYIEDPGLHRTLMGDGLATTLAALFGAPANTTYGENTGVLALSRIYDPRVIRIAAVLAMLFSFSPKFAAIISSMPERHHRRRQPRALRHDLRGRRAQRRREQGRLHQVPQRSGCGPDPGPVHRHQAIPALALSSLAPIGLSGLAVGSIVGIVLNAVMPGKDYVYGEDKQGDESVNFIVQ